MSDFNSSVSLQNLMDIRDYAIIMPNLESTKLAFDEIRKTSGHHIDWRNLSTCIVPSYNTGNERIGHKNWSMRWNKQWLTYSDNIEDDSDITDCFHIRVMKHLREVSDKSIRVVVSNQHLFPGDFATQGVFRFLGYGGYIWRSIVLQTINEHREHVHFDNWEHYDNGLKLN